MGLFFVFVLAQSWVPVVEKFFSHEKAKDQHKAAELVIKTVQFASALQKERAGRGDPGSLKEQRLLTDQSFVEVSKASGRASKSLATPYLELREGVQTATYDRVLDAIYIFLDHLVISNPKSTALVQFLKSIDRDGLQLDILRNALESGSVNEAEVEAFLALAAEKRILLRDFQVFASSEDFNLVKNMVQTPLWPTLPSKGKLFKSDEANWLAHLNQQHEALSLLSGSLEEDSIHLLQSSWQQLLLSLVGAFTVLALGIGVLMLFTEAGEREAGV